MSEDARVRFTRADDVVHRRVGGATVVAKLSTSRFFALYGEAARSFDAIGSARCDAADALLALGLLQGGPAPECATTGVSRPDIVELGHVRDHACATPVRRKPAPERHGV